MGLPHFLRKLAMTIFHPHPALFSGVTYGIYYSFEATLERNKKEIDSRFRGNDIKGSGNDIVGGRELNGENGIEYVFS